MPVRKLPSRSTFTTGTIVLAYVKQTYTNASFPYPDALTTSASLVAQWRLTIVFTHFDAKHRQFHTTLFKLFIFSAKVN